MKTALIGYTGFVGGNIAEQAKFSDYFDIHNIEEIRGREFDLIVCAGAPGAKWLANKEPENDMALIQKLMDNLATVRVKQFVLISTIDVYPAPVDVDEDSYIDESALSPYGKHRRMLEKFVENNFPRFFTIRFPGLFGKGLKKNVIYDFLNNNRIDQIHQDGIFQFYNLEHIWGDIIKGLEHGIKVLNVATEPISVLEVAREAFDIDLENKLSSSPPHYDIHTKYSSFWGKSGPYIYAKNEVVEDLKKFIGFYRKKINVGIVGLGYWGPVLLRNFKSHPIINVKKICDVNEENVKKIQAANPEIETCLVYDELLDDKDIDLVVIATPAGTHYELSKKALIKGKHVMVEKPFVFKVKEGEELISLAEKNNLTLMVDHPHIFQKDHEAIKDILKEKKLGEIIHYHSTRADFGLFQKDVNVIWHSLYHDIYIILDLFPQLTPEYVKAAGSTHIIEGIEDSAIVGIKFKEGLTAEFHVCLLFPVKERKIIIVGDKKIAHWDYTAKDKIRIYEKSAFYNKEKEKIEYRMSDAPPEVPHCEAGESLEAEVDYLVDCIKDKKRPKNDGYAAMKTVNILRFIDEAMKKPGEEISL